MHHHEPLYRTVARATGYITGSLALLLVVMATVSALAYAGLHRAETLIELGTSTLTGVGQAIGGCLGAALLLRYKIARHFVRNLVDEINGKFDPPETPDAKQ